MSLRSTAPRLRISSLCVLMVTIDSVSGKTSVVS